RALGPVVLGLDPRDFTIVNDAMDTRLLGHAYAKSAVDVACWDLAGRAAGVPLTTLLGGRRLESYPLYAAIPLGSADRMASEVDRLQALGVHQFQLKLGTTPRADAARVHTVLEAIGDEGVV